MKTLNHFPVRAIPCEAVRVNLPSVGGARDAATQRACAVDDLMAHTFSRYNTYFLLSCAATASTTATAGLSSLRDACVSALPCRRSDLSVVRAWACYHFAHGSIMSRGICASTTLALCLGACVTSLRAPRYSLCLTILCAFAVRSLLSDRSTCRRPRRRSCCR